MLSDARYHARFGRLVTASSLRMTILYAKEIYNTNTVVEHDAHDAYDSVTTSESGRRELMS